MNNLIFIILPVLIFIHTDNYSQSLDEQLELENDSLIIWMKNRKLRFGDFKKKGKTQGDRNEAYTVSSIDIIKELNYIVVATFYKYDSRLDNERESLLNHEQLHFDIAELFARKIRKEIFNLKQRNDNLHYIDYKIIYKDLYKDYRAYQNLYDSETEHSKLVIQQKQWQEKVAKELVELEGFRLIIE